jgi:hypothetical protein
MGHLGGHLGPSHDNFVWVLLRVISVRMDVSFGSFKTSFRLGPSQGSFLHGDASALHSFISDLQWSIMSITYPPLLLKIINTFAQSVLTRQPRKLLTFSQEEPNLEEGSG